MNTLLKNLIESGKVILFLGAGASYGSQSFNRKNLPLGNQLAEMMAKEMGIEYANEDLAVVYSAYQSDFNEQQLSTFFKSIFSNCLPSKEYLELVDYPFPRIYTLNIDDALEKAFYRKVHGTRRLEIYNRNDRVSNFDNFYESTQLIKLNGDANRSDLGFIFSAAEYGQGSANEPFWYKQLGFDYSAYNFIFIGTQLKEPLFFHQVEKYKKLANITSNNASFIITPDTLTPITLKDFERSNLHHISGTLNEFIDWLKKEFPKGLSPIDIVSKNKPELIDVLKNKKLEINIFDGVFPVHTSRIKLENTRDLKDFYNGFKPTWNDILEEVPALLSNVSEFYYKNFKNKEPKSCSLFMIFGIAGSGKSTALKQISLAISRENKIVYFIEEYKNSIVDLISELDKRNEDEYYIIIERPKVFAKDIQQILKEKKTRAIFISAENNALWNSKISPILEDYVTDSIDISEISETDATSILQKIEKFGNWTILSKMSPDQRKIELLNKARRQLLIGLIEATSGIGYQKIIEKEYNNLNSDAEKYLLLLSGIASTERVEASETTLIRALSYLGINESIASISKNMQGIIRYKNDKVATRHRIYIEHIFKNYVSLDELQKVIIAYINAFTIYDFPISKSINNRNEMVIYKHLVNFKFLYRILKKNKKKILEVYETFEKKLEQESLYLLQYGLALRAFHHHYDALKILKFAHSTFNSPHISHALAQQKIILAQYTKNKFHSRELMNEAVEELNRLIYMKELNGLNLEDDHYPIITLSEGHVKVLIYLKDFKSAEIESKKYLNLLLSDTYQKFNDNEHFRKVKKFLNETAYKKKVNNRKS
ncbi:SIR2 family protein [Acinetobacter bereziniae]|uniref:P-loop NTPase n=5 Tax=Acinetobacter bereziniae TaxID=106648 RepID=UPI00158047C0|nr:SIR2 family protein [Acinetobacter bereziniae]NUF63300.1 SIR2 family protein [Acinetobacter bereziniae]NUG64441.1 SIR2 family protein [Acinetobacter bereziniae]NUG69893.1 SIR2 family protein [Acinetobacter bereziniae]